MRAVDVLAVLDALADRGVRCWLDGGWGVDALLERQTREHADVDLAVDAAHLSTAVEVLSARGFAVLRDWLPTSLALRDGEGREVDLHRVEMSDDGGGHQVLGGAGVFHYGPPVLGRVGGRTVACCSPAQQVAMHVGYEPRDKDRLDVALLAGTFGIQLPPAYRDGGPPPAEAFAPQTDQSV